MSDPRGRRSPASDDDPSFNDPSNAPVQARTIHGKDTRNKDCDTDKDVLQAPYHRFFHPLLGQGPSWWRDVHNQYVTKNLVNLAELANNDDSSLDARQANNTAVREFWEAFDRAKCPPAVTAWALQGDDDEIVQATLSIPRRRDILREWGFDDAPASHPSDHIPVTVRLPLSVCSGKDAATVSSVPNAYGCRTLARLDWRHVVHDRNVPLILYFHGGGLTAGTRHDAIPLEVMAKAACRVANGGSAMLASVGYSLAPEHAFPTAVSEALTVVSYFLKQDDGGTARSLALHLWGVSAGANLATVAAMELYRQRPDSLASLAAWIPMLRPAADSHSFYMNRNLLWVSADWLRWCWRCYMGWEEKEQDGSNEEKDILSLSTMAERRAHGSNQKAWASSPWRNSTMQRLVDPTLDLPSVQQSALPPRISILTNRADPLYDDGIMLRRLLEEKGFHVNHVDHPGSHWLGTVTDEKNYQQIVNVWKDQVFGQKEEEEFAVK